MNTTKYYTIGKQHRDGCGFTVLDHANTVEEAKEIAKEIRATTQIFEHDAEDETYYKEIEVK